MKTIFEYRDYKAYLREILENRQSRGLRGQRSRLAESVGCQPAYVSRVLEGDADFSAEQADQINQFLEHTEDESEFLFLLVDYNRAGTKSLRERLKKKIEAQVENRLHLAKRLNVKETISEEQQIVYFSRWQNAAVHMGLMIPHLQKNRQDLAHRLGISFRMLNEVIEFLLAIGILVDKGDRFEILSHRLHLPKESPLLARHHINWRLRAIDRIERDLHSGLHYSSVVTIAKSDLQNVKETLITAIEAAKATIRTSADETLACVMVDAFEL